MFFVDSGQRGAVGVLCGAPRLSSEQAVFKEVPAIFGMDRIVRVKVGIIGVGVMFHVSGSKDSIGLSQWNNGHMSDQLIQPAQRVAFSGDNAVLSLVGRQVTECDVEHCDWECPCDG